MSALQMLLLLAYVTPSLGCLSAHPQKQEILWGNYVKRGPCSVRSLEVQAAVTVTMEVVGGFDKSNPPLAMSFRERLPPPPPACCCSVFS